MNIRAKILGALAAIAFSAGAASAATVNFVYDPGASSVNVNATTFGTATLDAEIVQTPASRSIATGDTWTFDFIRWMPGGFGVGAFNVEATLAFASPGITVNGSGSGAFATLFGTVTAGVLNWSNLPTERTVGGSTFGFDFEDGIDIFLKDRVTTATVTGVNVIPLPAAGFLLLGGLGGLGLLARRRKTAA